MKNLYNTFTFWPHSLLTGRLFFSMRVQKATRSRREWLGEPWICGPCGGEGRLGRGEGLRVPWVDGWGLSILCLGFRQRSVALQLQVTCSYSTATTHSFILQSRTVRGACWHWREVYSGLWCFRGCSAWLERRLEHVDWKPAHRETVKVILKVHILVCSHNIHY